MPVSKRMQKKLDKIDNLIDKGYALEKFNLRDYFLFKPFNLSTNLELPFPVIKDNKGNEINALFKEVKYNLEEVRDTKLVKPIEIGLLPNEIKNIGNAKKRKEMFIKIVLPLVVKENNKIRVDRIIFFSIFKKNSYTDM